MVLLNPNLRQPQNLTAQRPAAEIWPLASLIQDIRLNVRRALNTGQGPDVDQTKAMMTDAVNQAKAAGLSSLQTALEHYRASYSQRSDQTVAVDTAVDAFESQDRLLINSARDLGRLGERFSTKAQDAALSVANEGRVVVPVFGLIIALLSLVFAVVISRGISQPVKLLTKSMSRLAAGDLQEQIPGLGRSDELGEMAGAVKIFKDNAIQVQTLDKTQKEQERLNQQKIHDARLSMANNLEQRVGTLMDGIASAAQEVYKSVEFVANAAGGAVGALTEVGHAAENTTNSVQTIAAASEELSASINEISSRVAMASTISSEAMDEARGAD